MKVGYLVMQSPGTEYSCLGIIISITNPDSHKLWFNQRVIQVLNPQTGEELKWAEEALEAIA